jgi:hypothetical protein
LLQLAEGPKVVNQVAGIVARHNELLVPNLQGAQQVQNSLSEQYRCIML